MRLADCGAAAAGAQGKSLRDSRAELAYGAGFVQWFAEEAKRTYGDVIPSASAGKRVVVVKEPIGVAAMITPVSGAGMQPICAIVKKIGS